MDMLEMTIRDLQKDGFVVQDGVIIYTDKIAGFTLHFDLKTIPESIVCAPNVVCRMLREVYYMGLEHGMQNVQSGFKKVMGLE